VLSIEVGEQATCWISAHGRLARERSTRAGANKVPLWRGVLLKRALVYSVANGAITWLHTDTQTCAFTHACAYVYTHLLVHVRTLNGS
jgi:hypothetical protein